MISLKSFILCAVIGLYSLSLPKASAQFSRPLSVGIGSGFSKAAGDLPSEQVNLLLYGEVDYLVTPFISIGLQGQKGTIQGDGYSSTFQNRYYTGNVNLKVRVGQFLSHKQTYAQYVLQAGFLSRMLSNIYVGAGGGLIKNRISLAGSDELKDHLLANSGNPSRSLGEISLIVPLHAGIDIPIGNSFYGPKWAVNLNYQHTLAMGDNLDGILLGKNDQMAAFSVGIKYPIGNAR